MSIRVNEEYNPWAHNRQTDERYDYLHGAGSRPMNSTVRPATSGELLGLLADDRRRRLLRHLADGSGTMSIDDLVTALAEEEREDEEEVDPDSLRLRLYHVHLPRLADLGVMKFDRGTGVVRYLEENQVTNRVEGAVATLEES